MEALVIEIKGLWYSYNHRPILEDVNLSVREKDFLAIIGPNGGGKTTLLKLMMGILEPDGGSIRIFGLSPKVAAPRIGYVPQDIHINLGFPISVQDVVLMGRMRGLGGWRHFTKADRGKLQGALEQVEMWEHRKSRIGELSGGQRQRVFLARALVTEPQILFLDEPTASIDTKIQTDFYRFLKALNQTVTILVVSHDIMAISSYVRSVACVSRGLIFHDAPEVTEDMMKMAYHCPVDLVAHGIPHRVLDPHMEE
jgi:zinc transport system ATP-binding protein